LRSNRRVQHFAVTWWRQTKKLTGQNPFATYLNQRYNLTSPTHLENGRCCHVEEIKDLQPILLTPTFSKIMGAFIGGRMLDEIFSKFDDHQFGAVKVALQPKNL